MTLHTRAIVGAVVMFTALVFSGNTGAAQVNVAGSTGSAVAVVAMNGTTTHIGNSGGANPILVSTQPKYPPVDYKPQVFQSVWSEIGVPDARDRKHNAMILKNNAKVFVKLADMYKKTTAYALQDKRNLMIDVLTVQAKGGAEGFARSRKFAEYIFKSLKENGVENISLDPEPRDPIRLPPGLTDQPPRGKT